MIVSAQNIPDGVPRCSCHYQWWRITLRRRSKCPLCAAAPELVRAAKLALRFVGSTPIEAMGQPTPSLKDVRAALLNAIAASVIPSDAPPRS